MPLPSYLIMISILIAARNEENTILSCLQSIEALDFPEDQMEVWIGDDDSSDATYEQVKEFINQRPQFHLIRITDTLGQARGKANVLAQLARRATGQFLFITDADVCVPAQWITNMTRMCEPNVGIVTGVTVPQATSTWAGLQALEWVYALFLIHWLAKKRIPVTAMGNNMLITRESYEATGGYERIPFSITEDFQLFREVIDRGYEFRQTYQPETLALTLPIPTLKAWLHQRKRWTYGALQLRGIARLLLLTPLLLLAFLLAWVVFRPFIAVCIGLGFALVQIILTVKGLRQLKISHLYKYLWLFPLYSYFSLVATLLYYYLPTKTVWKGRSYE